MLNGPLLVTQRLILRPPAAEDFEAVVGFYSEPETMEHLGGVKPRSEVWRAWCCMAGSWHINGFGMFSLIERATGRWIGRAGPWRPADWPVDEVGWGVARDFAGKGYAREAAVAAIDYAFDVLGWDAVHHVIAPKNAASIKLAERLGSRLEGPTRMPAPFGDKEVQSWGQTREEWRTRKN
ncbi:GNAT family N-acetyltransferase [Novosphingopyxis iocasae]|uniref:GNAT family N-acetyltransferase n=1 Tax=Novosphingopyxis iocasae TaxID=2762729 RepID=UPI0016516243|nr:GNAT family N-acetyltransferase [Novosphingopyxis iocasae]